MRTRCNKCGAEESTNASLGAKCMFCKEGIMVRLCQCDKEAGLLCYEHNQEMMEAIENGR